MGLSATYINQLIQQTLSAQRQPIYALTAQKDQLNVKKAVYSDLKNMLQSLGSIIDDLTSDDDSSVFDNRTATSSDNSVVTATAASEATSGTYDIVVDNLAQAQMVRSDQQSSNSESLNLSGTFTLNDVNIEVETDDSLADIAEAINDAEYADGDEVTATIVDNHLVIEAASTGISNQLSASDQTGTVLSTLGVLDSGSFKTTLQAAEDASFTVNDISITRSSNTDLDDVITGVTLNLLSETEGDETAESELVVAPNSAAVRAKTTAFVNYFNSTISYLTAKTKTTGDQEKQTYSRGILTGETVFSQLKANLVIAAGQQTTLEPESPGDPTFLSDIGITLGDGMKISLDTDELNSMLESNFDGVAHLLNGIMNRFEYILEPFTTTNTTSNTLDLYTESIKTRVDNIDTRIEGIEAALVKKEDRLITQYSSLYMQNIQFTQQQYGMLGIYSNFSMKA